MMRPYDDGLQHSSTILHQKLHIEPGQQGAYFTLPFDMDEDVETLRIRYTYMRFGHEDIDLGQSVYTARPEISIIDTGLVDPRGEQVGASGSDKTEFWVSETGATPGYRPCRLAAGRWQIIVGAYKVAPEGTDVFYEIEMIQKTGRWLKGDLHAHTVASDGVLTVPELAQHARANGLDFLAITDHNQMVSADALPRVPGLTLIPGVEWTHYQGHANFLGVDRPYDEPFFTNTLEEALARFVSARERGALITANHPFEPGMGFELDLNALPFDCVEIWNGPMRESNLRSIGYWQSLLAAGKKVPACGGSDYHRDTPFIFLGGPTTCVYAMSRGASDILDALRKGRAFITFAPYGPKVELAAGEAIMGGSVKWSEARELRIAADGLLEGDVVRVVTASGSEVILQAPAPGRFEAVYAVPSVGFARVGILRSFIPGLPQLPALISNPIYFD